MEIQFTKMHGIGNDFMVIDAVTQRVSLDAEQIRHLADRHFGVGFDQLLLVEKASHAEADFRYRIFNADGGEVSQCGNGARCFVRFVVDKGLTQKREITVETASGLLTLTLQDNGQVTVNMGAPRFTPAEIPFIAEAEAINYALEVSGVEVEIGAVSMGNPHAVQVVADVELAPVTTQGALIEAHTRFPERVNAGYMQIISPRLIKLRVFERGSGETLACGSGACAAVVVGIRRGLLFSPVSVEMRGGVVEIRWDGIGQPVWMTGPAECVFDGKIELKTREQ